MEPSLCSLHIHTVINPVIKLDLVLCLNCQNFRDPPYVAVRMKLTRSGRTVTKPAKFATGAVVDKGNAVDNKSNVVTEMVDNKVNVVTRIVDNNKVNMVTAMMDRVDNNVGLVGNKDGKTRELQNPAKSSFLIPVELQKENEEATYIVRLPEKAEVERLKEEYMEVEGDVDDPMAQEEEEQEVKEKEDFSGSVVFEGTPTGNHPEGDGINQFSLSHIPIEVIEEEDEGGGEEEEFEEEVEEEEREKTEWQEGEQGRLNLVRQLGILQQQQQVDEEEEEEEDISDHVISIEENGHITIEQVHDEDQSPPPHSLPAFPDWWTRISSTFLSFLSTGHLVDLWLVCSDGEAVPAHLVLLSHASPYLNAILANAARDTQVKFPRKEKTKHTNFTQEDAVTLSLPDWDSQTVGQFVSALYQGHLPDGKFQEILLLFRL